MCGYLAVALKIISLIALLQTRSSTGSKSSVDSLSVGSGLTQRTKEFSDDSPAATGNDTEYGSESKSGSYKHHATTGHDADPTRHQHEGKVFEDVSKMESRDLSEPSESTEHFSGVKTRQSHKTQRSQRHKAKHLHYTKPKKPKSKSKLKRKKSKLGKISIAKSVGGETWAAAGADVKREEPLLHFDDRFPDKGHSRKTSKAEPISKQRDNIESLMHMLLKTNKSTRKGKSKPRIHSEEDSSRLGVSTTTPFTNETLQATKEALIRESLRRMHTELIKLKILRLLRMERPPNITKPMPKFPHHFLEDSALRDEPPVPEITHHSEPSHVVVFAEKDLLACPQKTAKCVNFDLDRFSGQRAESAELWVYKEYDPLDHHNHTLVVYQLQEADEHSQPKLRHVVDALETEIKHGWVKFSIRKTVDFWLDKPHRNYGLQIFCKTCKAGAGRLTPIATSNDIRPVLIIRFSGRHRVPRGLPDSCHSRNTVCCKEKLKIDFKAIGWNFIIYPKTIEPSFCRGTCERANTMPGINTHHSRFLKNFQPDIQSCCAPTKMRHVSMLVMDEKQNIIKQDLELVVGECGCVL